MIYFNAFLVCGLFCLIAQLIVDFTKLSPGHVTSIFAAIGSFLSFFGIYSKLIKYCGMGAIGIIVNFGSSLYLSALAGYKSSGLLGIFTNFLNKSSLVIVATIMFSFITLLFFKPKD